MSHGTCITVLGPSVSGLQTGGNVYNRRMAEASGSDERLRVVPWEPEAESVSELDVPEDGVLVLDSLLARTSGVVRTVRSAHPGRALILLVHYLRCIDPTVSAPEDAAAEREALGAVDGAVTTSRFAKRSLVEEGVSDDAVKVVPPGLDECYRGALPARPGRAVPRMLTVANLLPEKGLRSFVEVLRGLRSLPWTWTLVERIQRAGLSDRVTYPGTVPPDTLRTWYDRADLFVLPSRFETRSLAMQEAMARGLPVVGYRVGGVAENFGDASAGHLVPPGDAGALRAALRSVLADPAMRRQRGRNAWRRSQNFPTWAEAAGRFRTALTALYVRATEDA
ncbi:MAG: glycosyltransferase family 4 protein [Salinibacter sp.]